MKIIANDLCFGYADKIIFKNINIKIESSNRPLVILGPSGSGKTTFLKLLGGLLKPDSGEATIAEKTAFMFQEARLLPWFTVLENIWIPLEKELGKKESIARAKEFLSLVSLSEKADSYPAQLSGGEAQRVSMARAFAWPAQALFMDEPFQSLDISLGKKMMNLTLSLYEKNTEKDKHILIMVTHDPREAVYMGGRVVVLGKAGQGIVLDKNDVSEEELEECLGSF